MNKIIKKHLSLLKPTSIKTFILLLLTHLLFACSGGGGGSSSSKTPIAALPPATLSIAVAEQAIKIADAEQITVPVTVTYTGTKELTATLSEVTIDGLTISQAQNSGNFEITFAADDLLGKIEEIAEFTVTVTDHTLTKNVTLTITTSNTSLLQLMDKTAAEFDAIEKFDVSGELANISLYVADKAYLYGVLSYDEKAAWLADMTALVDAIQSTVTNETKDLLAAVLNQRAEITESEAINQLTRAKEVLSTAGAEFNQLSAEINALSVPNLRPFEPFVISLYNGQFSLFYGNNAYGTYTSDQWTFVEKWLLLNKLLPVNTQSCPANNA